MNRVAGRAGFVVLLVLLLLAGTVFFLFEYICAAGDWVMFSGSPHIYNGGELGCAAITDRDGILLLDMTGDRTYSSDAALRKATVHWVGDRFGSIDMPTYSAYA